MERVIYILLILCIFTSCKTLKDTEYIYINKTDTFYQNKILYDSVYLEKLVYTKGDTVFQNVYDYKYKTLIDTIYKNRIDSVYQTKTEVQKVPYKSGFQTFCQWFTIIVIVLLILYIVYRVVKIIIARKIT